MNSVVVSVPDQKTRENLGDVPEGVEVIEWDMQSTPPRDHIDMVIAPYFAPPAIFDHAGGLSARLIQLQMIGFDNILGHVPDGHVVANAHTVHETATAELTLALLLATMRDVPRMVRQQDQTTWDRYWVRGLADANVLMIGTGAVGRAIAQRLLPFEVDLVRVGRSARDDEFGHVHAQEELPALLPEADVVILIVPLTAETDGMVDDAFLGQMKDGAVFLNVARGQCASTEALIAHADRLRIVVDVMDPEPLPAESQLWSRAALVSPHLGGLTDAMAVRLHELLQRQLGHLLAGEEPENVVIRTDQ